MAMKKISHLELILNHLKGGGLIPFDAMSEYGVVDLSRQIRRLKSDGHNIIRLKIDKRGGGLISQYWLKDVLKKSLNIKN